MNATVHNIAEARSEDIPFDTVYEAVLKAAQDVGLHAFAMSLTAAAASQEESEILLAA